MKTSTKTPEANLGWLAGIFDGEGSCGLYKSKGRHLSPSFSIGSKDLILVQHVTKVAATFGAELFISQTPVNGRPFYWAKTSRRETLAKLISVLAPRCVLKAPQLWILHCFLAMCNKAKNRETRTRIGLGLITKRLNQREITPNQPAHAGSA